MAEEIPVKAIRTLGDTTALGEFTPTDTIPVAHIPDIATLGGVSLVDFNTHLLDTSIHFTQAAISVTESQISDLQSYSLTSHTHTESDITDLQSYLLNINSESITNLGDVSSSMTPVDGEVLTYDSTNGWQSEPPTTGTTDHTLLSNIGTFTHSQIDTHLSDTPVHFTQAAISVTESQISDLQSYSLTSHTHTESDITDLQSYLLNINSESITNLGDVFSSMTPSDGEVLTYDSVNGWQSEPPTTGTTDHTLLSNIGTFTHSQIDTHLSDTPVHFTQAAISITESQISDLQSYSPVSHNHAGTYEPVFTKNTAFNDNYGTASGTVCEGNDSRLSDARTPLTHTHTESDITDLQSYLLNINSESITNLSDVLTTMTPTDGQVLTYDSTNGWQSESPGSGVTDHTLLSNIGTFTHSQIDTHLSDTSTHFTQAAISITESQISDLGTYETAFTKNTAFNDNYGIGAGTVCEGNDSRLSDARTPLTHTHTESDITDLQPYLLNINSESIEDLGDVSSSLTPTDGEVLTYDTNQWVSSPNMRPTFAIFAEEAGTMSVSLNNYEYSFGNGAAPTSSDPAGILMGVNCTLIGIGVSAMVNNSTLSTISISVVNNGSIVATGGIASGSVGNTQIKNMTQITPDTVNFSVGDTLQFLTASISGSLNVARVVAWFERTS